MGLWGAVGAALLGLAASSKLASLTFVPKYAVVMLFAAFGLVPLARLLRAKGWTRVVTGAAVGFLTVALISALLSPSPNLGFFGLYLWGTGWIFWLGAIGAFAIGASLRSSDLRWLFGGLLVAAVGNAVVGIWQVAANPQTPLLSLYGGSQAEGLLGNPIYLEAILLGGLALVLGRTCRSSSPLEWAWWGSLVLVMSVALEYSGERLALIVVVALVAYAVYSYRMRGAAYSLLIAVGYGIGYLGGGSSLGNRVTSGTSESTTGLRLHVWEQGLAYAIRHPLFGIGPGQLRTALQSSASLSFAQVLRPNRTLADGHDIFVEVAVTTGLLGLAFFVVFLGAAARVSRRGAFLGFAGAVLAVGLVEPMNVATVPLMMLALGASLVADPVTSQATRTPGREENENSDPNRPRRVGGILVTSVAAVLALALGASMIAGDTDKLAATQAQGGNPFNLASAHNSNDLLPYWPESALTVAEVTLVQGFSKGVATRSGRVQYRNWIRTALRRDTRNPDLWTLLGDANLDLGNSDLARSDYLSALGDFPWYTAALQDLGFLSATERAWSLSARWYETALATAAQDSATSQVIRKELTAVHDHRLPDAIGQLTAGS